MKLLLDENLSRRLVPALQLAFPGSSQQVVDALLRQQAVIEGAFSDQSVSMVEVIPPLA